jgi:hypothetical protein
MNKWNYFRQLLNNAVPSAIAVGGALIASMLWLKALLLVFAMIAYILVSYFQAGLWLTTARFNKRSVRQLKDLSKMIF